jgi:hypothetical protein
VESHALEGDGRGWKKEGNMCMQWISTKGILPMAIVITFPVNECIDYIQQKINI